MLIENKQGRQLKRRLLGKEEGVDIMLADRTLDEIVSALHKYKVFTNRETIPSILNREYGLDLTYLPFFPLFSRNRVYGILIIKNENNKERYRVSHYFKPKSKDYTW